MAGQKHQFRILLIEDHPLFREGLRTVLNKSADFCIAAEAASVDEALQKVDLVNPDVIITDLRMGDKSGQSLIARVHQTHPHIPIVVLSMMSSDTDVLNAIQAGAKAYLTKLASGQELLLALSEVMAGRSYLDPKVAGALFNQVRHPAPRVAQIFLTSRELEMLTLLGTGASPQTIASKLFLSVATVKTHMRSLFRKFDVSTRTQLVLKAIETGYIKAPTQG